MWGIRLVPGDLGALLLLASPLAHASNVPRHATVATRQSVADAKYDFVIAGGGISGLTVADRLTEDPNVNVLVIEAGPFDKSEDTVLVPGAFNPVPYMWLPLNSVPQTELKNQTFTVTLGRVVGGGSVINGMVFLRAGKQEYAAWEELGAHGWGWNDLLPYFIKSENFTGPEPSYAAAGNISYVPSLHGHEGPVQCSYPNFFFKGSANWWDAALSTGLTPTDDPNGGSAKGVTWFPTVADFTTRTRSHARLNHYSRVKDSRPNYHILAEHSVSRVLFDDEKRAVGVEYLPTAGGEKLTVSASKEVFLAANAVHTPQILQLSGVGPKKLLDKFGIKVVSDLPGVGANFHDQPSIRVPYTFTNNIEPNAGTLDTNKSYDTQQRALYDASRQGPYVIARSLSTTLALPPLRNATSAWKEIVQAARKRDAAAYLPPDTDPTVLAGYKAQRKIILDDLEGTDTPIGMIHWGTGNSVTLYFIRPLSRGSIVINSTNILVPPLVDFRTVTDPTDFDLFISLFKKSREIMNAPSMKILGPKEDLPFGEDITDDAALKEIFSTIMNPTTAHECCTASMRPKKHGGVVDKDMKVYGVKGLRVIDISYWPMVLTAAPTATMYASAEKIADTIKRTYCLDGYCDRQADEMS